jgi:pimeloyl-ACP methyl ester carboxylesterase
LNLQLKSGTVSFIDQGAGAAVLLLHAFPLNSSMWAAQIGPLSNRFRVIAPDVRGFGESRPASPWTVEEMADDLDEFLGKLGVTDCAVVGVSMGGYIALPFWLRHRERVRQLVLANSRARADNETEKNGRNEMIAAIQQNGAAILPDRMLPRLLKPNPSADSVRIVRGMIEAVDPAAAAYAVMAMRDRPDFSSVLHRVDRPTLVITGEDDVIIRLEDARATADTIPGARFVTIPNSGHLSNLENPEEFNRALLGFLEEKN